MLVFLLWLNSLRRKMGMPAWSRILVFKFFFVTLELLLEMPSCKNVFQMSSFLWINLFVAPCCVPGHFENETFFQEFYPAVNIYIHQVTIKPNNFLISNPVCRSQIISPVAVSGTLCTWSRREEKKFPKRGLKINIMNSNRSLEISPFIIPYLLF